MTSASWPPVERLFSTGSSSARPAAESVPIIKKLRGSVTSAEGAKADPMSTTGTFSIVDRSRVNAKALNKQAKITNTFMVSRARWVQLRCGLGDLTRGTEGTYQPTSTGPC